MKAGLRHSLGRVAALGSVIWALQHVPLSGGQAGVFGFFLIVGLAISEDI